MWIKSNKLWQECFEKNISFAIEGEMAQRLVAPFKMLCTTIEKFCLLSVTSIYTTKLFY